MKKIMVVFLLALFSSVVQANVVINEVYYDPIGTESGGEIIEIHNKGSESVDISGWIIATPSSEKDATIPDATVLESDGYYLIADVGFSESKDNPLWPDADYEESITLKNSNGGLALQDTDGSIVDALGWGDAADIEALFYSGTPHPGSKGGESLQREGDAKNNAEDFESKVPSFQSSKQKGNQSAGTITFTVIVEPKLNLNVTIFDEDDLTEGIQVFPLPGETKEVTFQVHSFDAEEVIAKFDDKEISLNQLNSTLLEGVIPLAFYQEPGEYTLEVKSGTESSVLTSIHLQSLNAFEIDTSSIECILSPGKICSVVGDLDMSTSATTLRNLGNTAIDLELSGTNLQSTDSSISVGSIYYRLSGNPEQALQETPKLNTINLAAGLESLLDISFKVDLPSEVEEGSYISSILIASVPK